MKRISKCEARKLYQCYKDFIMVPCNLRPDSFAAVKIDSSSFERMVDEDFDSFVNAFEYYNCTCGETGRKAAFYTEG